MTRNQTIILAALITSLCSHTNARAADDPAKPSAAGSAQFNKTIAPFFKAYCTKCHGQQKKKGKLTLHDINPDMIAGPNVARWQKIIEQLEYAEMPPEEEKKRPTRAAWWKCIYH